MEKQAAGPSENTRNIIRLINVTISSDAIDNPRPTLQNWYIGYSDSPQIRTGKRRFYCYDLEDKVQAMIVFSTLRGEEMNEERYHISNDSKIRYIMLYHD